MHCDTPHSEALSDVLETDTLSDALSGALESDCLVRCSLLQCLMHYGLVRWLMRCLIQCSPIDCSLTRVFRLMLVAVRDALQPSTLSDALPDAGWGGNYFVIGGKVNGGQVLGKYPDRLDHVHSDENDGRARMIPSTPWESIWNGVAEWYGVDEEGREAILPMMKNFENSTIFSAAQLFEGDGPTPDHPVPTPTPVPPSITTRRRRRRRG